jgi:hypothetical protein
MCLLPLGCVWIWDGYATRWAPAGGPQATKKGVEARPQRLLPTWNSNSEKVDLNMTYGKMQWEGFSWESQLLNPQFPFRHAKKTKELIAFKNKTVLCRGIIMSIA